MRGRGFTFTLSIVARLTSNPTRGGIAFAATFRRMLGSEMAAPVLPLIDAARNWPMRGALLGLDLGTKTIGVAMSDADRRVAAAVETIRRTTFSKDAARLMALAGERNAV